MASVLICHSAYGRRRGLLEAAERLRQVGYEVHVPDLYDGAVHDDLEDGLRTRDRIGRDRFVERASRSLDRIDGEVVLVGVSLGTRPAQLLAGTRPRVRGVALLHGAHDPASLGTLPWPATVPVAVHRADGDPWVDPLAVDALRRAVVGAGADFDDHRYGLDGRHLFSDPDLAEGDPAAAELVWERVRSFCASL